MSNRLVYPKYKWLHKKWLSNLCLIIASVILLSGCQYRVGGPLCPNVTIASQMAEVTRSLPVIIDEKGKPIDGGRYQIILSGLNGSCKYNNLDNPTSVDIESILHIDFLPIISQAKSNTVQKNGKIAASQLTNETIQVHYFLTVLGANNRIISRRNFIQTYDTATTIPILREQKSDTHIDLAKLEIGYETGTDYRLVYGLLLSDEELKAALVKK